MADDYRYRRSGRIFCVGDAFESYQENFRDMKDPADDTIEELKKRIDSMDYEQLLYHNRFGPSCSPLVQGEVGTYFMEALSSKKSEVGHDEAVATSKRIGW